MMTGASKHAGGCATEPTPVCSRDRRVRRADKWWASVYLRQMMMGVMDNKQPETLDNIGTVEPSSGASANTESKTT